MWWFVWNAMTRSPLSQRTFSGEPNLSFTGEIRSIWTLRCQVLPITALNRSWPKVPETIPTAVECRTFCGSTRQQKWLDITTWLSDSVVPLFLKDCMGPNKALFQIIPASSVVVPATYWSQQVSCLSLLVFGEQVCNCFNIYKNSMYIVT